MTRLRNMIVNAIGFILGFGSCMRCHASWWKAKYHSTIFVTATLDTPGQGCLPLCEDCWQELGTPEKRLPYYRKLILKWDDRGRKVWPLVEQAVKAGK